jgi:hypothetical protein
VTIASVSLAPNRARPHPPTGRPTGRDAARPASSRPRRGDRPSGRSWGRATDATIRSSPSRPTTRADPGEGTYHG